MATREKIKFQTGVPVTVQLDSIRGTETPSNFGDGKEYRFYCRSRGELSMFYVPVDGQIAITNSGAREGDEVQITRTTKSGGWLVKLVSDAVLAVNAPLPGPRLLAPSRPPAPTPLQQDVQRREATHTPEVVEESAPIGTAALMTKCLQCAIDVLSEAEAYAIRLGWAQERVEFNAEDVRAMANTFYIQKTKVSY
jgi:hypothetical protein